MTHLSEAVDEAKADIKSRKPNIDPKEQERIRLSRRTILASMGVPKRYREVAFDTYDVNFNNNEVKVNEIKELVEQGRWVVLSGRTTGIGKTHLAISAMGRLSYIKSIPEWKCLFVNLRSEGERLLMAGLEREDIIKDWMSKKCLLLDELGREPDKMINNVERIIDGFYNDMKPLIITTPLSKKELRENNRYDGSILRRITDCGKIIEITGKTYRVAGSDTR